MVLLGPAQELGSVPSTLAGLQDGTLDWVQALDSWKGHVSLHFTSFFSWAFQIMLNTSKIDTMGTEKRDGVCHYLGANQMCQIDNLLFHFKQEQRRVCDPLFSSPTIWHNHNPGLLVPIATWPGGFCSHLPSPLIVLSQVSYQTFKNLFSGTKKRKTIFVFWENKKQNKALAQEVQSLLSLTQVGLEGRTNNASSLSGLCFCLYLVLAVSVWLMYRISRREQHHVTDRIILHPLQNIHVLIPPMETVKCFIFGATNCCRWWLQPWN